LHAAIDRQSRRLITEDLQIKIINAIFWSKHGQWALGIRHGCTLAAAIDARFDVAARATHKHRFTRRRLIAQSTGTAEIKGETRPQTD
jgi:hypothetical protein